MCFPIIGLVFAVPGLICGIIALRNRQKARHYEAVTSDIRSILAVVFSTIGLLYNGFIWIAFLASDK